jgi:hypothetical protein
MHISDWVHSYADRYARGQDRTDLVLATLVRCPLCTDLVCPGNGSSDAASFCDHSPVLPPCLAVSGSDDVTFSGRVRFRCPQCNGLWESYLRPQQALPI